MRLLVDDGSPIFQQIAQRIEDDIVTGRQPEQSQVPSTNELAAFYQINPATAAKGVNLLVDEGVLYKKRGIGMFVATGARQTLINKRQQQFYDQYVVALLREATKLGITRQQLFDMIERGGK